MEVPVTSAPDSIEVVSSSEEGGNGLPVETPAETPATPSETPATEVPAEPKDGEPATPAETELYELPDGRKVDAATLATEWRENFLPEFTRKSQALAAIGQPPAATPANPAAQPPANPLDDPNYVPGSYAELTQHITARLKEEQRQEEQTRLQAQQALEQTVETQLNEVKALDPQVNESALFLHATKYGFRDLRQAHTNMRDMLAAVKATKTQTATEIAKRNDPVSVTPGASGAKLDPSQFATAREYLRALKGQG